MSRRSYTIVGIVAVAVRLIYLLTWFRDFDPTSDADQYDKYAHSVAKGDWISSQFPFWYEHPTAFRPPLYPLLLGSWYKVTGGSLLSGMLMNVVLGVVVVLLIALLANEIGGHRAGMIAGLLAAFLPSLVANDVVTLSEPLGLALMLGGILAVARGRIGLAALLVALLVLTRPSAPVLALTLAAFVGFRYGWRHSLRFVIVISAIVAPWIARNYVEVGRPVYTTSVGFNLSAIYSDEASAHNGFVDPFLSSSMAQFRDGAVDEGTIDRELTELAFRELRSDPLRLARVARRQAQLWFEIEPGRNDLAERLDGRVYSVRRATFWIVWPLAMFGTIGLWRSRRRTAGTLSLLTIAAATIPSLFTVVAPRLRSPCDALWCVGVGLLASSCRGVSDLVTPASVRRRGLYAAMAVIVMSAVIAVIARQSTERSAREDAQSAADGACAALQRAHSSMPIDPALPMPVMPVAALESADVSLSKTIGRLDDLKRTQYSPLAWTVHRAASSTRILTLLALDIKYEGFTVQQLTAPYEQLMDENAELLTVEELNALVNQQVQSC